MDCWFQSIVDNQEAIVRRAKEFAGDTGFLNESQNASLHLACLQFALTEHLRKLFLACEDYASQ